MRQCARAPIPEIFHAAKLLDAAVAAYALGDLRVAASNIALADQDPIRAYTKALWSRAWSKENPPSIPVEKSQGPRTPGAELKRQIHARDGYSCRYCGIPVIRPEVRKHLDRLFPDMKLWGDKEHEQHAALQVMWAQYDHVVAYSRRGATTLDNMVLTCAPCNFGKDRFLPEEVGLEDPRKRPPRVTAWTGLEEVLALPLPDLARPSEVVIRLAAEGGGCAILGRKDEVGWLFSSSITDRSAEMMGDLASERHTPEARSLTATLQNAARHWDKLYPDFVLAELLRKV